MIGDSQSLPLLDELDEERQAASRALTGCLREMIADAGGVLGFREFMEAVLYEPALGYYVRAPNTVGGDGDFVTAPELGPLFATCLASPTAQTLKSLGGGTVTEIGAGSGVMARDVLLELVARDALPEEYRIVERSPALEQRQRATLAELPSALSALVRWTDAVEPMRGIILANELLDALAVERFVIGSDGPRTLGVGWGERGFEWRTLAASEALQGLVAELNGLFDAPLPTGYRSEWCPQLEGALDHFTRGLQSGVALLVDYGYPRAEYYHPQRVDGTLLCHFGQRVHADPFLLPGLQDITASVDFTAVARAGHNLGFDVAGYCSQTWFLMGCGLESIMARTAADASSAAIATAQAARRLLLPGEMGERIQAMALTRDHSQALSCFELRDQRARLEFAPLEAGGA